MSESKDTSFAFGDFVRVKHGFYRRSKGTIVGFTKGTNTGPEGVAYVVRLQIPWALFRRPRAELIREEDLEACL